MLTKLFQRIKSLLRLSVNVQTAFASPQVEMLFATKYVDYYDEFVHFENEAAWLAGTLTHPRAGGKLPAVVLLHGSGPHTRDEIISDHYKLFHNVSDYLSRRRIAVLRYDKRGVAYSKGDYAGATILDFAHDAFAAVEFLKTQPQIDASRIVLVGHSEGGMVAPLVATRSKSVCRIIFLAAPALPDDGLFHDPRPYLRQVTCPALAVNGDLDMQVSADENLESMRACLSEANNADVTLVKIVGVNHLFQKCVTGSPDEYTTLQETFAPEVLEVMAQWILRR